MLFFAYLRLSWTYPLNSDSANIELMAWDMLHGNVLLHGWSLSDVSFSTTELPQYALLEAVLGPVPGTAHVAAAMTYTLVVLLAAVLAKGRASGREAIVRVLLAVGIMLVPQQGPGVFALVLSVGHIGTAVPVLLTWLVIDRARPRWYVPPAVGALLAWVLVADPLALVVGVAPLAAVCGVRAARAAWHARDGGAAAVRHALASRRYELSLGGAGLAAAAVSWAAEQALRAMGGYVVHSVPYAMAGWGSLGRNLRLTGEGLLVLFGADVVGAHGAHLVFALLHLVCVVLALCATALVLRWFFTGAGLVDQVVCVAMVLNVALYLPSTLVTLLNAREIAVVLPCAAVLTARRLGGPVGARTAAVRAAVTAHVRAVVLPALVLPALLPAAYVLGLVSEDLRPPQPPANAGLAHWLAAHHLTEGLGGYWEAGIVTVDSGQRVTIRALSPGLDRYPWESEDAWYDPGHHSADFLVTDSAPGFFNRWEPPYGSVLARFGVPVRTYHLGRYTVYVWKKNLLPAVGDSDRTGQ